jgi:hypothetical protein
MSPAVSTLVTPVAPSVRIGVFMVVSFDGTIV